MNHEPVKSTRRTDSRGANEAGYVMATTALLLIPLMIFAAFATDVGAWYVRGQQAQRAADAASLAGVVWMPNLPEAEVAALQTVQLNGYPNAVIVDQATFDAPGPKTQPEVLLSTVGAQQLRVDIKVQGEVYFGSVVAGMADGVTLNRFATAEYVLPVPMGNPTSALGTGVDTAYGAVVDNFWLTANAPCDRRRNGDFIQTIHARSCGERANNINSGGNDATYSDANPLFQDTGHTFIVDVPADPTDPTFLTPAGNFVLQVRMTCFDRNNSDTGPMAFTVYSPDNTPLNDFDNELDPANIFAARTTLQRPTNTECGVATTAPNSARWAIGGDPAQWVDITNTFPIPGRYIVKAENPVNDGCNIAAPDTCAAADRATSRGRYSMRVVASGTGNGSWGCSRILNSVLSTWAQCPNIFGREYITVNTESAMLPAGTSQAELYLAEVEDQHIGKTLEIIMFDAADGIDNVQILAPNGNPVPFSWQVIDNAQFGYGLVGMDLGVVIDDGVVRNQTCAGTPCLTDPFPQFCWSNYCPGNVNARAPWLQDRTVKIEITLDSSHACVDDGTNPLDCWWQVRYVDNNGTIGEVTTWNVRVIGDPVRLVD